MTTELARRNGGVIPLDEIVISPVALMESELLVTVAEK